MWRKYSGIFGNTFGIPGHTEDRSPDWTLRISRRYGLRQRNPRHLLGRGWNSFCLKRKTTFAKLSSGSLSKPKARMAKFIEPMLLQPTFVTHFPRNSCRCRSSHRRTRPRSKSSGCASTATKLRSATPNSTNSSSSASDWSNSLQVRTLSPLQPNSRHSTTTSSNLPGDSDISDSKRAPTRRSRGAVCLRSRQWPCP